MKLQAKRIIAREGLLILCITLLFFQFNILATPPNGGSRQFTNISLADLLKAYQDALESAGFTVDAPIINATNAELHSTLKYNIKGAPCEDSLNHFFEIKENSIKSYSVLKGSKGDGCNLEIDTYQAALRKFEERIDKIGK